MLAKAVYDVRSLLLGRLQGGAILDQLNADEQSRSSDVTDHRVFVLKPAQSIQHERADVQGPCLKVLLVDDAKDLAPYHASKRTPAERAEEFHPVCEGGGNCGSRDHRADRVPISHRLAQD